jgi:hypothetical protein
VNAELDTMWKDVVVAKYYSDCLEEVMKIAKIKLNANQNS